MPVFQIEVHKRTLDHPFPGDEWLNVWHVSVSTLATALVDAVAIVVAEQALYKDTVEIYKFHAKEYLNPTAQSVTEYISYFGSRTVTSDQLPAWNVARIDWNAPPATRSVRKYLRASCSKDDTVFEQWTTDFLAVLDAFATDIATEGNICNPGGIVIDPGDFRTDPLIAMRQVGWSRRARPGFHREYVPNT